MQVTYYTISSIWGYSFIVFTTFTITTMSSEYFVNTLILSFSEVYVGRPWAPAGWSSTGGSELVAEIMTAFDFWLQSMRGNKRLSQICGLSGRSANSCFSKMWLLKDTGH